MPFVVFRIVHHVLSDRHAIPFVEVFRSWLRIALQKKQTNLRLELADLLRDGSISAFGEIERFGPFE